MFTSSSVSAITTSATIRGVDRHAHQQVLAGDGDFIPATRPDPSAAKASGMASPTSFPST